MYRRAARDRMQPPFPREKTADPNVARGALVIVGGGGMPASVTEKFIELAGGPEAAIVVLATGNPDPLRRRPRDGDFLTPAGPKNVKVLQSRKLHEVESPEFLEVLREARGIWFGGGRQWRFVD